MNTNATATTRPRLTWAGALRRIGLLGGAGAIALTGMAAGVGSPSAQAADSEGVWDRVAECESGGDWSINTGNGYYGGLQFSLQTWEAFGGEGMPHEASKQEQIRIAQNTLEEQGPGALPVCSEEAGLTKENGMADDGDGSDDGKSDDGEGSDDSGKPQLGGA